MMSGKKAAFPLFATACLTLGWVLACPSAVHAQPKTLTIENNSGLPLTVFLDAQEGRPNHVIGYVDAVSRKTFGYALETGRWYVTIEPYAPGSRAKPLSFLLYVKAEKFAYVYEVQDRDFGEGVILPPENVSILGHWESGPWMYGVGLVVEFSARGEEYIGTIVSCASDTFMSRNGFYVGMELIARVRRTGINKYEGLIKERRGDGTLADATFGVLVERGTELYPYGWKRMETRSDSPVFNDPGPPPGLQATVTALNFYEGPGEGVPYGQRAYGSVFAKSSTRYINWELNLAYPKPGRRVDFKVDVLFYSSDGREFGRSDLDGFAEADWMNSQHTRGFGWAQPGSWPPGKYRVDVYLSGVKTASGEFEITW